jgi:hypothetical protein
MLRMTVAVRLEDGRVEVDSGGLLQGMQCRGRWWQHDMTKSLRKRTVVARFEGGVEATACSRDGDEATTCSGAGMWMAGGSGGTVVSTAAVE